MDIFKLVGSVFVDTDKANDSLKKTDKQAEKTGGKLSDVAGKVGQVGGAIVAGAGAAVGGMVALASQTASNADEIDKMSQRMGIGAETLQQYQYAAELSGVSTGTLEKAAKKLEGTDINFDQAMQSVMSFSTEEERLNAAIDMFGETVAYNLTPMLNQTKDELNATRQEAYDLGLVMSNEDVKAGADLNDAMTKVQDSFQGVVTKLGTALMPLVTEFADMIIEYMPEIQGFMDEMIPIVKDLFSGLMPPLMDLASQIFPVVMDLLRELLPVVTEIISAILPVIVELLEILAPVILEIVQKALPVLLDLIMAILPILGPILELITPILQLVMALLDPLLDLIDIILPPLINILVKVIEIALKPLQVAIEFTAQLFEQMGDAIVKAVKFIGEKIKPPLNTVIGFINGLIDGVTNGINSIIRAINKLDIKVPEWVTEMTGMTSLGFNLNEIQATHIPLLAKGGELSGGSAIVGEDGPELLSTNGSRTRVTPLNDNNNAFVGIEEKLDTLIALLSDGFGVYLDANAVAGKLAPSINKQLGRAVNNNRRAVAT